MATPLKIVFVGEGCSGKTHAVDRLMGKSMNGRKPYVPTHGATVHHITNANGTMLDIWDCGGTHCGLRDAYFIDADICVIFGPNQYEWMRDVKRIAGSIIFYPYDTFLGLRNFIGSINNMGPVGHITDETQTVINVFN